MSSDVKPHIAVFGNSHVSIFGDSDELLLPNEITSRESLNFQYTLLRLGGATAYNFFWNQNYYPKVLETLKDDRYKAAHICLLLGEVDCRMHINNNHELSGRPLDECIEEVVDRMMICYLDIKKKGHSLLIVAVQPSSVYHPENGMERYLQSSYCVRNTITRKFNSLLEHKAKIHNIPFCGTFDELMIDETLPDMSLFLDPIHLRNTLVREIYEKRILEITAKGVAEPGARCV